MATPAATVARNHQPDLEFPRAAEIILTVQSPYGPVPAGHMDHDDDRNGNGNFRPAQRQHLPRARLRGVPLQQHPLADPQIPKSLIK